MQVDGIARLVEIVHAPHRDPVLDLNGALVVDIVAFLVDVGEELVASDLFGVLEGVFGLFFLLLAAVLQLLKPVSAVLRPHGVVSHRIAEFAPRHLLEQRVIHEAVVAASILVQLGGLVVFKAAEVTGIVELVSGCELQASSGGLRLATTLSSAACCDSESGLLGSGL